MFNPSSLKEVARIYNIKLILDKQKSYLESIKANLCVSRSIRNSIFYKAKNDIVDFFEGVNGDNILDVFVGNHNFQIASESYGKKHSFIESDVRQYDPLNEPISGRYSDSQVEEQRLLKVSLDLSDAKLKYTISFLPNQNIRSEFWEDRALTLRRQERLKTSRFDSSKVLGTYDKVSYIDSFKFGKRIFSDGEGNSISPLKSGYKCISQNKRYLAISNMPYEGDDNLTRLQRYMKVAKSSRYTESKTATKRLLKVINTFVLPTHTPLNVITNSYDVIHSWFIPALGIKFDCVPGKTTTHMLYIEDEGYYFGQCAEICGRYHHHMPIRFYACNFSEFIIWWSEVGVFRAINNEEYSDLNVALNEEWFKINRSKQEKGLWKRDRKSVV